jgi:hypothetical protein
LIKVVVISIEDLTFKSHIMDIMIQIVNINNFIGFFGTITIDDIVKYQNKIKKNLFQSL